jgi:RNA 3'-terminal phosphate cyclase (ATP)
MTYIEQVYLPMLRRMGITAQVKLGAWGWYPRGGGEVNLQVKGGCKLTGIDLLERGELKRVRGLAVATELPAHIPQRMASRAENLLRTAGLRVYVQALREKGVAPGAGIFLTAEYRNSLTGFGGFGRLRLSSEKVAEIACEQLLQFHQLLLPAVLASGESHYKVSEVSTHLTTNAAVIEKFGLGKIRVNQTEKTVVIRNS